MNKNDVFDLDVQIKETNLVQPDSVTEDLIGSLFCSGTFCSWCC
ncbi:hypothetical protein BLGI_4768 [Brevibacillus laterosporus GI-9]|nr:FDLD family class I lanthipeptide [Brevibacillus laterosporus]CCF16799.1 hypothetical protein BLGI_4768 [Brevibacillus laterosporus GI-9]